MLSLAILDGCQIDDHGIENRQEDQADRRHRPAQTFNDPDDVDNLVARRHEVRDAHTPVS